MVTGAKTRKYLVILGGLPAFNMEKRDLSTDNCLHAISLAQRHLHDPY